MLPEYFIQEELERLRRQKEEQSRPQLEVPRSFPLHPEYRSPERSSWDDCNQDEAGVQEIIIRM